MTEHATLFQLHRDEISPRNNAIIQEVYQKAARVICVSRAFARLIDSYRTDIDVVGNVVNCDIFIPPKVFKNHNEIRFLTVCYMEEEAQLYKKGMDILIQSWTEIVKENTNVKLVIGGGGKAVRKVVEWTKEYHVTDSVEFLGTLNREQVVEQMQMCDCFVLPSRYETFGVVYIEAMACGKPVIAVANGGPDDFVKDFNGMLIKPDVEELTGAINKMIKRLKGYDYYYEEEISSYIKNLFSYDSIAGKLLEVYKSILTSC